MKGQVLQEANVTGPLRGLVRRGPRPGPYRVAPWNSIARATTTHMTDDDTRIVTQINRTLVRTLEVSEVKQRFVLRYADKAFEDGPELSHFFLYSNTYLDEINFMGFGKIEGRE